MPSTFCRSTSGFHPVLPAHMTDRYHPLQLLRPGLPELQPQRRRRRRRRSVARLKQAGLGLLLTLTGSGILLLLLRLPRSLDTLLLVSNAVANLIRGLTHLGLGLLQLAVVLLLVLLALLALLLLIGGCVRMVRAVLPSRRPSS
jgi:hypothetical protein